MVHNAITKHIVTKGDYNMVPAGQALFECPNCNNDRRAKVYYNVAPGQLVAYTISTTTLQPITVDNSNVASITGDLYIGVGVDTNGDGAADDVRLLAGEKFERCFIDEVSTSSPACGQPQILGAYINDVQCGDVITAKLEISDNRTRSFGLVRADQEEIAVSATADCSTCTDCSPTVNTEKVICSIVDQLNDTFDWQLSNGDPYPDKKQVHADEKVYKAVRLHSNWHTFCIDPIAQSCDCADCELTNAIEDVVINGTTYTFSGNLNPSNNAQTYLAQLESIADQIEAFHETALGNQTGFAFVSGGGPNNCCPYQLHVITCDDSFELHGIRSDGSSGQLTACDAINPFPTISSSLKCVNCGDATTSSFTGTNGLAVLIKQPKLDCGCYIDKPLPFYSRIGELSFIKELDELCPTIKATELMAPVFPRNFGAWVQWLEYSQETGGKGRTYRDVNANQGWLRLPDNVSRAKNAITHSDCGKSYCTYYLGHYMTRRPTIDRNVHYKVNRLSSYIHIPSDDLNTLDDWETFLTTLLSDVATECKTLTAISCNASVSPAVINAPASSPLYSPSGTVPTYTPSYTPNYAPNYGPAYVPSYAPNYAPNYTTPTYTPI